VRQKSETNKSGIYLIKNKINNKIYIGSALNIRKRWKQHRNSLRKNKHYNRYLQSAFNKNGFQNFEWSVIEYVDKNKLTETEQKWLNYYRSFDRTIGYNLSPTASSCLGVKHSEESKKRMSKSHMGNRQSEETKEKIRRSRLKKVYQFDENGELLNIFNSILEAERQTGIARQAISGCCRGITKFTKNYRWSFNQKLKNLKGKKSSKQIIHNLTKIIYSSIQNAADNLKVNRNTIIRKLYKNEFDYI
jgi:hypothetical protein